MLIKRIILGLFAIGLVLFLYNLPMVVVENEEEDVANNTENESIINNENVINDTNFSLSSTTFSQQDQSKLENLRQKFFNSTNNKKSTIFADSLATLYSRKGNYDSATWFADHLVNEVANAENLLKAGSVYYHAFEHASDANSAKEFGEGAREYLNKALEKNPDLLEAKVKLGMTYVASPDPMKGITMLREVLETDPDNQLALFYLGILSIQSSQYDLAADRFSKLLAQNPDHVQAHF